MSGQNNYGDESDSAVGLCTGASVGSGLGFIAVGLVAVAVLTAGFAAVGALAGALIGGLVKALPGVRDDEAVKTESCLKFGAIAGGALGVLIGFASIIGQEQKYKNQQIVYEGEQKAKEEARRKAFLEKYKPISDETKKAITNENITMLELRGNSIIRQYVNLKQGAEVRIIRIVKRDNMSDLVEITVPSLPSPYNGYKGFINRSDLALPIDPTANGDIIVNKDAVLSNEMKGLAFYGDGPIASYVDLKPNTVVRVHKFDKHGFAYISLYSSDRSLKGRVATVRREQLRLPEEKSTQNRTKEKKQREVGEKKISVYEIQMPLGAKRPVYLGQKNRPDFICGLG